MLSRASLKTVRFVYALFGLFQTYIFLLLVFEEELEEKIKKDADGEYETIFLALFTGFKRSGRHKSDPKATANVIFFPFCTSWHIY